MGQNMTVDECREILTLREENKQLKEMLKNKSRPPGEFSKVMYKYNVCFVTVVTILSFILMFYSGTVTYIDLNPLCYIVPGAYAELSIHTAFMVWKAKCENIHKYPDIVADVTKVEEVINRV